MKNRRSATAFGDYIAIIVVVTLSAWCGFVNAQNVNTYAGTGVASSTGDGGLATVATLGYARSLGADKVGNLLIPDSQFHTVRLVNKQTGVISTIAGTGGIGYAGDGGLATAATFVRPEFAIGDSMGNIFIGDVGAIRKIDTNGIITTIAGNGVAGNTGDGGQAILAQVSLPLAAAFDPAGNLVFVDYDVNVVRQISPQGVITRVAGTGSLVNVAYNGENKLATAAVLNFPSGIAIDSTGNIYLAIQGHSLIRKITLDGKINTIAGQWQNAGYNGDGNAAVGSTINNPIGIAVDAVGNVYFTDTFNHLVRKIDAQGVISAVLGNATATDSGDGGSAVLAGVQTPWGIYVDTNSNLFVGTINSRVRKVAAVALNLGTSNGAPNIGQAVTFTATLADNTLLGTMLFQENGVDIAGCTAVAIAAGIATCTMAHAIAGTRTILAGYGGAQGQLGVTATVKIVVAGTVPPPVAFCAPLTFSASVNSNFIGLGTISPEGVQSLNCGAKVDFTITANPRYRQQLTSTCDYVKTSFNVPFVPIGTGASTYSTEALYGSCSIEASFFALVPNVNIAGQADATTFLDTVEYQGQYLPPAVPAPTHSAADTRTTFIAWVTNIAGVPYPSAENVLTFTANGVAIADCTAVPLLLRPSNVVHIRVASCTTSFSAQSSIAISANFAGDTYNFPASAVALKHNVAAAK